MVLEYIAGDSLLVLSNFIVILVPIMVLLIRKLVGKEESSKPFYEVEERECEVWCAMFEALPKGW